MKKTLFAFLLFFISVFSIYAQKSPLEYPDCRNTNGGSPENPATLYLGDAGTFGCDSWATCNTNWPRWRVVIHTAAEISNGIYGTYTGYVISEHKSTTSPRFTSTGTWYWGIQVDYGGNPIAWYCRNSTSWYAMWGVPTSDLTVTINSLNNPSSQTATRNALSPDTKVDLSWSKDAQNHLVMIVRKLSTGTWTEPTQGTAYVAGNAIGDGIVVYAASNGISFTDQGLASGSSYDYKFYSENYSYYSAGVTSTTVTTGSASSDYFQSKASGDWNATGSWQSSMNNTNWIDATLTPTSSANSTTILNTHTIAITDAHTVNGLTINNGGVLNINAAKSLTVNGAFSNSGTVTLQSPASLGAPGSLITNGTVSGNIVAERYIPQWTTSSDGWHLISSPVNNMAISGSNLAPGSNDDLYKYDEVNNMWLNYKVGTNNITNFTNGIGFLCSYAANATKSFTGIPNTEDITFNNLTLTGTRGWNLLGNPFPCAIKWNDGHWTLTNMNTTAKVMNPGGTYTDKTANGIIPAMQGFFVQVTSGTGTVTIPKLARTHDASTDFYKSTAIQSETLMLTAKSNDNNTFVETVVKFDPLATTQFDDNYDAHFLQGIVEAPQLYSVINGGELLSTNTFPPSSLVEVPVNFIKGISSNYTMNATGIESFTSGVTVLLEDLKTGTIQDLIQNQIYPFTSVTGDNPSRFKLHFNGPVSIDDKTSEGSVRVYSSGRTLCISNSNTNQIFGSVVIYNLLGQEIASQKLDNGPVTRINVSACTGYYLVKVITGNQTYTTKIFLN